MPVNLTIPAPRSLNIGNFQGKPVPISRDWLKYLADDLPRILGGIGTVNTVPEVAAMATQAISDANTARNAAETAMYEAQRDVYIPDVRAGSNVSVRRDAQGFVISADGSADYFGSQRYLAAQVLG